MKKLKVKKSVVPIALIAVGIFTMMTALVISKDTSLKPSNNMTYVSNTILSQDLAVINTTKKMIYPYTDLSTSIGKTYYDYKGEASEQEKSIIYHENTYIQNSGLDFINNQTFDVVAVLEGTVTNVKEDKLLGKIVEINHNNEYISIYQSLSEINVKKDDKVYQGQSIGKSGINTLDKELGNHLHFELYVGGQVVDPILYLDKEIKNIKE